MSRKSTGRIYLTECPSCGEELMDMGFDKENGYYEKHCPKCEKMYRRIRGYGHKWQEIDEMEI
jgi:hypothetical protein